MNLKLPYEVHLRLRRMCKKEHVTIQKALAKLVRQYVGLQR